MREAPFTVREANSADAQIIAAVCATSWRAGYEDILPGHKFDSAVERRQAIGIARSLEDADVDGYVAENEKGIIGFVMLRPQMPDSELTHFGQISALYVDPELWRQGVGKALCNHVVDRARGRSMRGVMVWTLDANRRAVEFFQGAGFVADGASKRWSSYGGSDTESRLLHEFAAT